MTAILPDWSESDRKAVRDQLDRIVKSGAFHQSRRRQRFLEYIVNETLAGRGELLKGYNIALAVFDRTDTFDSNVDPIVRMAAGRLRDRLREYYETDGRDDPVRIELPKGTYTPQIEFRQAATSDAFPDRPDRTHAATQDQSPNLAEAPAAPRGRPGLASIRAIGARRATAENSAGPGADLDAGRASCRSGGSSVLIDVSRLDLGLASRRCGRTFAPRKPGHRSFCPLTT